MLLLSDTAALRRAIDAAVENLMPSESHQPQQLSSVPQPSAPVALPSQRVTAVPLNTAPKPLPKSKHNPFSGNARKPNTEPARTSNTPAPHFEPPKPR